jgi:hypothetical protein
MGKMALDYSKIPQTNALSSFYTQYVKAVRELCSKAGYAGSVMEFEADIGRLFPKRMIIEFNQITTEKTFSLRRDELHSNAAISARIHMNVLSRRIIEYVSKQLKVSVTYVVEDLALDNGEGIRFRYSKTAIDELENFAASQRIYVPASTKSRWSKLYNNGVDVQTIKSYITHYARIFGSPITVFSKNDVTAYNMHHGIWN